MQYNLKNLKTKPYLKKNITTLLRIHNIIQEWNTFKGFDKNELHQLINSTLLQDPYLYKEFPVAWQEIHKYLTAQTQMAYKLFFGDYDFFEFEHQAMFLCILHDNITDDLEKLTL